MIAKNLLICLIASSLSGLAMADYGPPSHTCFKPWKPNKFTSEAEVKRFYEEVDQYKRCINDFVNQQVRAIEVHKSAADAAVEQWNMFVRMELNN